ncbi:hypothetical protein Val02_62780 [Virgisporangium aliadipatigenens]|uniref:Replication-relaxation n=1 Tax=Virgisporangium aliadipatigenens TaxID=741659 RepID=A0A8J4DUQ3_9ACTN|nr:replication-relaxation family protein [Virgisporangium aliadipatigenens]GIJ49392.1 hypothetical protein Val02_62780 [Virgisporangium aliadipatigenens]
MIARIPASGPSDPFADLRRLTGRDLLLLSWLAEHYVLSTEQIATALFPSTRSAQKRLTTLHRIGAVSRWTFARTEKTSGSYRYTLGTLGVLLHPHAYTDPDNPAAAPPRSHLERRARILRSPRLEHLLGVNTFFTDLHARARTSGGRAELLRWWSEQHATAAFRLPRVDIRPDGHGIWREGSTHIGLFLEHDRGTEDIDRVLRKLGAYERLAADGGPRFPILLWVPDPRRETSLLNRLSAARLPMAVATAVHNRNPAGPVWALAGASRGKRLFLFELPSQPGSGHITHFA